MLICFQLTCVVLSGSALYTLSQGMLFTGACFTSASLAVLIMGLLKNGHKLGF
jgi:hypothetical protein